MKILANSLPKSGTHVLTRILDLSGFQGNNLHFSSVMTRRGSRNPIKIIKNILTTSRNEKNGFCLDLDGNNYLKEKYLKMYFNIFNENTYSQAHLPYAENLENILEDNNIKMLYIIRDPRDVLVSHFHHHLRDKSYDGYKLMNLKENDKDRILLSLYGFNHNTNYPTLSLKERVNRSKGWYFSRNKNICAIKFEDIIGLEGSSSEEKQIESIQKIENFLNLEKNFLLQQKNKIYHQNAETFRKGQVKDWINYLSGDLKKNVKDEIGEVLIELGYENDTNW